MNWSYYQLHSISTIIWFLKNFPSLFTNFSCQQLSTPLPILLIILFALWNKRGYRCAFKGRPVNIQVHLRMRFILLFGHLSMFVGKKDISKTYNSASCRIENSFKDCSKLQKHEQVQNNKIWNYALSYLLTIKPPVLKGF